MSLISIAKEFRWEMGHRLPFHRGLCKNIHGHSYRLRVEICGEVDENGMVLDYYELKSIVQPTIDRLDHSFICDQTDTVMMEFFKNNPMKIVVVPFSTTAEHIVGYLLDDLREKFNRIDNIATITLRLYETEQAFAEATAFLKAQTA